MSLPDSRMRPAGERTASKTICRQADQPVVSSIDDGADLSGFANAYVVVVLTADEKRRRRVFLSLHSAEKAADRARTAGHRADLFLARLRPVGIVGPNGGESR